ncbi:hypothetical protein BRADI_3g37463v3 [Brachypodium distachyon]|uniref:Uncharacterized protein n=1 Tax=Brachypodium distachyon TaxID=15368 RepID=A0A2K2D1R2_BRADI|nr:hypothetical protein BRADI_3g37463v3 [Brachypodium distachyon]
MQGKESRGLGADRPNRTQERANESNKRAPISFELLSGLSSLRHNNLRRHPTVAFLDSSLTSELKFYTARG